MPSILSLPPEVISEFFQWALVLDSQSGYSNRSGTSLLQDFPPINVSQVCRNWRHIALSDPSLWAFIEVDADGSEDLQRALPRVKTWLQRSSPSSAPLSLKIKFPTYNNEAAADAANRCEVADSLFQELGHDKIRWKEISISSDLPASAFVLNNLPILQELQYDGRGDATTPRIDLSTIPLLRRFSASGPLELSAAPSNLVLASLTFINVQIGGRYCCSLTASDCLRMLRWAPHLAEFRVEIGRYDLEKPAERVHLVDLNILHVSWSWLGIGPDALRLLDGIEAPSLKALSVDYPDHYCPEEPNDDAVVIICSFISRCNISLSELRMSSTFEDLDIVDILRLSPDLQKLDLHCYIIPNKVYTELSKRLVNKKERRIEFPLCPRLASIFLSSEHLQLYRDHEKLLYKSRPMVKMISRRWNVPTSQRSLVVVGVREIGREDVPELKKMVSKGLDFRAHWEM